MNGNDGYRRQLFLRSHKVVISSVWHVDNQENFPTLHQRALDTLLIPIIFTKCERVFSGGKKLLSPYRCRIQEDLVEATECLTAWEELRNDYIVSGGGGDRGQ